MLGLPIARNRRQSSLQIPDGADPLRPNSSKQPTWTPGQDHDRVGVLFHTDDEGPNEVQGQVDLPRGDRLRKEIPALN